MFAGTALGQVRICEDTSQNTSVTTSAQETFVARRARTLHLTTPTTSLRLEKLNKLVGLIYK